MNIAPLSPGSSGDAPEAGEPYDPEQFPHAFPYTWAMLLARIYDALPLVCPRCGSAMRIIAFITHASDVKRILDSLGEASGTPPISPSRAPPEEEFGFNQDPPREEEFDFDRRTEWDNDTGV
jgi:hypothetical protein